MEYEKRYFAVTGGKVKEIWESFLNLREEQYNARLALTKEVGADHIYANSREIAGFIFEKGKRPQGDQWRVSEGMVKPAGKSPEAKALRKRMRELPLAGLEEFTHNLTGHSWRFMDGLTIRYANVEEVGDHMILIIPASESGKTKWTPPDDGCREMKTSEYWTLKEAQPVKAI